jgi:Raf kinase inhibitor-like YbhB/YbcL family protein
MNTLASPRQELTVLRNAHALIGHELRARDGIIGEVEDLYFDDEHWCLRYFVVKTGAWLKKRSVLVSPEAVHGPEWNAQILPVDLTQEQIGESPSWETDRPVSRQYEQTLRQHYGWPFYWGAAYPGPGFTMPRPAMIQTAISNVETSSSTTEPGDSHLRSVKEVSRYRIRASDGEIGRAVDFLIDDRSWNIRYLVVDTHNWLPGKKVVVSPWWITEVKWIESEIVIDLSKETIRGSPDYDPENPMTVDYAGKLHDYYGRPRHTGWQQGQVLMSIEIPVFENGGSIPIRYTRYGENRQPPLLFDNVPPETVTLALLLEDPDAPKGTFTHWIAFNLNPQLSGLVENSILEGAQEGLNDAGRIGYTGPFPPSGEHRYFFRLYALDCTLNLPGDADRETFVEAMEGHVIAEAVWMGRFATPDQVERKKWTQTPFRRQ